MAMVGREGLDARRNFAEENDGSGGDVAVYGGASPRLGQMTQGSRGVLYGKVSRAGSHSR